jgi:hypothetical protein
MIIVLNIRCCCECSWIESHAVDFTVLMGKVKPVECVLTFIWSPRVCQSQLRR